MKPVLIIPLLFIFLQGIGQKTSTQTSAKNAFIETAPGLKLEYSEQGDPKGLAVILLHGFTDSRHSYDLILPHLPNRFHVFAITQRGHGDASKPDAGYNPKDFAGDISVFMKNKGLKKAVIVGHSMGSIVAQQFALDYPELTKGLVMIATFADFKDKPEIIQFKQTIDSLQDPIDRSFAADFQKSTLYREIPSDYFELVVNESMKVPVKTWKGVISGLLQSELKSELKNINCPTLIVWGDKDLFSPRSDQDFIHQAIKNSELLVYEETGHGVHWEDPMRFANDLNKFVNRVGN